MEVITLHRDAKQLLVLKTAPGRPPLDSAAVATASDRIRAFMQSGESVMVLSLSPGLDIEVHAVGQAAGQPAAAPKPMAKIAPVPPIGDIKPIDDLADDPASLPAADPQGPEHDYGGNYVDPADPLAMPASLAG